MASPEAETVPSEDNSPQREYSVGGSSDQEHSDVRGTRSLKQAYINEKSAPELLQYAETLVADTQRGIAQQEALLEEWDSDREQDLVAGIVRCELQRVRYLLRGYLRTRIRKIEGFVMAILDDPLETEKLSRQERSYALEFFRQFGRYMSNQFLDHLPKNFDSMAQESSASITKDMVDKPDLERHVFCRVLKDCGDVATDTAGDTTVPFKEGDLYVVSYQWIRQLLAEDYVDLV